MLWSLLEGSTGAGPYGLTGALALVGAAAVARRMANLASCLGVAAIVGGVLAAASIASPPALARTVSIGAYVPNADHDFGLIDKLNQELGRPASTMLVYKSWDQAPFVGTQLEGIWNHGAVPLVTWEPWGAPLKRIAHGRYDHYVRRAARAAAGWNRPLMLRFGQEMNGDWFPWGGHAKAYRAAWRHLVELFRRAGAAKVRWVWTPYVNGRAGRLPFAPYFPGEQWIDWAGLDAINWGGSRGWRSFGQIAGGSYRRLAALTSRPIMLGETGSGEVGGSKPHWLSAMLHRDVPRMKRIRALVFWSKDDPRGDLRIDSSAAALSAMRSALAGPLYASSRHSLLETPSLPRLLESPAQLRR